MQLQYELLARPTYSLLEAHLQEGQKIVAEAGAMTWMSDNIRTETSTRGGFFGGLKRMVLTGESFFQNTYVAEDGPGTVGLAPGKPGDIIPYEMNDSELILEKGAYLASEEGVKCDSKFQGLKGLFNEGMFALRCTGTGLLFFTAYGRVQEVDVKGEYVVDSGYAVAWEPSLEFQITRARKIRSFLFSDQLLLRYHGYGKLWVQSRSPRSLASWVYPFRPVKSD
ncbi:MAG: TIGR00266 family protein [Gemmataceae bacterium]